jgi:hypothetical protein
LAWLQQLLSRFCEMPALTKVQKVRNQRGLIMTEKTQSNEV